MIRSSRKQESGDDSSPEINLSPLIDCVFILLIFYIVTTVFVEETGIEVNKPAAAASIQLDKNSIQIAVTEANEVFYAGTRIGVEGVTGIIKRQLAERDVPVVIVSDKHAEHGVFSEVYGAVKAAGATKITFSTER